MKTIFGSKKSLLSAFISFTQCEEEEAYRFLPLLIAARNSVAKRLKDQTLSPEAEEELIFLSAAIAAEQWAASEGATEESTKVGEITLSAKKSGQNQWRGLIELLEASCAEFLADCGFFFENTGGF